VPSPKSGFTRYDVALLVVSLIWGANFSANKYALTVMPPLVFSASRFLLASLLLFVLVRALPAGDPIPRRTGLILAGLGVVGNTAYQTAFMYGLKSTTVINGSLILASLPVFVAVLGIIFRVERTSRELWLGMLIAVGGVAIVIVGESGAGFSSKTVKGDLLVLAACFCWAAFTVGVKQVGRGLSSLRVTAITTYGGTPGLVLLAWPDSRGTQWTALSATTWIALLYSAVFAIVVAYLLWGVAVQGVGSNRTAIYNCVVPVFAALTAWVLLGERPGARQLVGAALVFAGVLVSQRQSGVRSEESGTRTSLEYQ
jgi:drug/metabolite transporter (DMT)-like permease